METQTKDQIKKAKRQNVRRNQAEHERTKKWGFVDLKEFLVNPDSPVCLSIGSSVCKSCYIKRERAMRWMKRGSSHNEQREEEMEGGQAEEVTLIEENM